MPPPAKSASTPSAASTAMCNPPRTSPCRSPTNSALPRSPSTAQLRLQTRSLARKNSTARRCRLLRETPRNDLLLLDAIELVAGRRQAFGETARAVKRGRPNRITKPRCRFERAAVGPLNRDLAVGNRDAADARLSRDRGCNIVEGNVVNSPLPATRAIVRKTKANLTLLACCWQPNRFDLSREGGIVSIRDIRCQRG